MRLSLILLIATTAAQAADFNDARFGVSFTVPADRQVRVDAAANPPVAFVTPLIGADPAITVRCNEPGLEEAAPDLIEEVWTAALRGEAMGMALGGRTSVAGQSLRRISWHVGGESKTGRWDGSVVVFLGKRANCAVSLVGQEGKLGASPDAFAKLVESVRAAEPPPVALAEALAPGGFFRDDKTGVNFSIPAGYEQTVTQTAGGMKLVLTPAGKGHTLWVACGTMASASPAPVEVLAEGVKLVLESEASGSRFTLSDHRVVDVPGGQQHTWAASGADTQGPVFARVSTVQFPGAGHQCTAAVLASKEMESGALAAFEEVSGSIRVPVPPPSAPVVAVAPPPPPPAPAPEKKAAPRSAFSDLVDTRLTFAFADDNLLAGAGETSPSSPAARIGGGRQNTLFFDNYETRYTGYESLSHIVLYRKQKTFIEDLDAEAALVWLIQSRDAAGVEQKLVDDSSYVRANLKLSGLGEGAGVSLVAFPISADRMRLGYSYKVSWGGSGIFPNQRQHPAPGAKLQFSLPGFYAFGGAKTTLILNEQINEPETNYGFLGGFGVDVLDELRVEVNGGYFQQGVNPKPDVLGMPVRAGGGSIQIAYHVGTPVGSSVDFKLYKNDPDLPESLFRPERYTPGSLSYVVATEFTLLSQVLSDFQKTGSTKRQNAYAMDVQVGVKYDYARLNLIYMQRSLAFIQFNTPGLPPFTTFPEALTVAPESMYAIGVDYHFADMRLTPGFWFGIQQPATLTGESPLAGNNPIEAATGKRTQVVRDQNQASLLPPGESATNIVSTKLTLRMDLSETLAAAGDVNLTVDNNRTRFRDDERGIAQAQFDDPFVLGFNLVLQARF